VHGILGSVNERNNPRGRIVIHEVNPVTGKLTGFDVEILHTQAQFLKAGTRVEPGQEVGEEGGKGVTIDKETGKPKDGPSHAHIQVFNGTDPTPLNPLRHLYEYHHPGQPIPDLPELAPYSVPPRHGPRLSPESDPIFNGGPPTQQPLPPQTAPTELNPPARAPLPASAPQSPPRAPALQPQFSPGMAIPNAEGPTSLGGPNGPAPLVLPQPMPDQGKRSDIPGDATQATPADWAFSSQGPIALGGVLKYFNPALSSTTVNLPFIDPNASASSRPGIANGDVVPERRLANLVANLSVPAAPTSGSPDAQGASQPLLGIFSGRPMPDWPVQPSIFQPNDQASSEDDELFQRWMRWLDA
jgi:hypothetical protein